MYDKHKKRKSTRFIVLFAILLCISIAAYLLADRYLIEKVEVRITGETNQQNKTETISIQSDDWNYTSSHIAIHIKEVSTGEGRDKVTYFVADVKFKDISYLHTAFAKNKFGRNIVEDTSVIAKDHEAILAINGDYYGFRGDGVIIRNGTLYRDIPARIAAAIDKNGMLRSFDETETSSGALLEGGVVDTFSFGPALVKDGKVVVYPGKVVVDTNFGNWPIQGNNPRTGIGMIDANHFVFIVVDGRMNGYSKGMTLTEFARVFEELGCVEAYNLDGGGSSTMYFMGRVVNNPLGKNKERGVSDIIYIKE